MYLPTKPFINTLVIASLFLPPTAWSATDCPSQECSQMLTQVDLLRAQISDANGNIKKLENALSMARQNISVLQNSNTLKFSSSPALANGMQRTANGHGR